MVNSTETFEIRAVSGFQVVNKKYMSEVFDTIEKAKAHEEKLLKTPEFERTITQKRRKK